jgi:peptidoglycan/LPS O-acetylase OafA/YrhL
MQKSKVTLAITSTLTLLIIIGLIIVSKGSNLFAGLNLVIFILIVGIGLIAFVREFKKNREIKAGFPADDELSKRIKYKAGYHTYMASMYMWLFIFLLRDKFPDTETMLGGGILISALLSFIISFYIKRIFNENPN